MEFCSHSDSLRDHFQLPCVSLHLPVLSSKGGEGGRGERGRDEDIGLVQMELPRQLPPDQPFCQVSLTIELHFLQFFMSVLYASISQLWYDLGSLHFKNSDFPKALSAFSKANQLLSSLTSPSPLLDKAKLRGYLTACACVVEKGRREGKEEEKAGEEKTEKEEGEEGEKMQVETTEELQTDNHKVCGYKNKEYLL